METSNATLIELNNFLFLNQEDFTVLQIFQNINEEAKELLLDMQKYENLIGYYCMDPRAFKLFKERLQLEGLNFTELFIVGEETYDQIKVSSLPRLKEKYQITHYIDETEESPWQKIPNLYRLKY